MSQSRLPSGQQRFRAGFTLVELMVTLAVAAVLIGIAVPSFKHMRITSHLTTTTNTLIGDLHAARMEAIKRNADTQFCGSAHDGGGVVGNACGTTHPGAVIGQSGVPAVAYTVRSAPTTASDRLHVKNVASIRYGGQGIGRKASTGEIYNGTVAVICSAAISKKNTRTIKMVSGSIIKTETSDGACP